MKRILRQKLAEYLSVLLTSSVAEARRRAAAKLSPKEHQRGRGGRKGGTKNISEPLSTLTAASSSAHCSKSSFFGQKFKFDFPRKLSIFGGEKLVKILWFWTF